MFILGDALAFPPVTMANEDGLLAIGGDLCIERLLLAYSKGIFPWYNEEDPICWWSPDPRFVLFPSELKISRSMQGVLRSDKFHFSVNEAFEQVINHCKTIPRKGQEGTWITADVKKAYTLLHKKGHAHSAEAWMNGQLVGGLYGVKLGNIFFGESMFSLEANASKFAFIRYSELLQQEKIQLIDCQVYTEHLESLGARMISRELFTRIIAENAAQ
ncbi:MAG TPA: leucyl/phenylalanyl-tRNA--protein transferase [Ferruginibacter sp.]|nr:leucyl/phenylalanyl-tRNA--protein transferase [Chitinophagaceae bacterium]HRI24858.1 leucyl/phenylalanyl-tRNA--protein transferase [Ferruginibacter sp.]